MAGISSKFRCHRHCHKRTGIYANISDFSQNTRVGHTRAAKIGFQADRETVHILGNAARYKLRLANAQQGPIECVLYGDPARKYVTQGVHGAPHRAGDKVISIV